MPVPLLGWAIRRRHSAVDEERGGRVVARHICETQIIIKLSSPHKPYYNLRSNLLYVSGQSDHVTLSPISLDPDMK